MTKKRKFILILAAVILTVSILLVLQVCRKIFAGNTMIPGADHYYLLIPSGSTFEEVKALLIDSEILKDMNAFEWVSEKKNYANHIRPGRYKITAGMNNNDLVNMLRSGRQEPVQLIFTSGRSLEKLCGIIAHQIEADSTDILNLLRDGEYISTLGFNQSTIIGMFIPNTYEVYWNSTAIEFLERIEREYRHFWTEERKRKAENLGLTMHEVSTLASIIDEETNKNDEKPIIAGVYLNRLRRRIPLQACPTLRFATGDYTIRRVLLEHMDIESPYNTYKNRGLPPGPINIPSIAGIDAVLNAENHDYFYFSAKEDLSGYHYFSKTLAEHNGYARLYQKVLDEQRVYK